MSSLIPKKYKIKIQTNSFSPGKIEKFFLKKKLEKDLWSALKSFANMPITKLDCDLNRLNNPILKITPYDKEAVEYGLTVLNADEILEEFNNLSFNEVCNLGYTALLAITYFKNDSFTEIYNGACKKMIWFQSIESKYEKLATEKGMYDRVFKPVLAAREELDLNKKYIKLLTERGDVETK